MFLKNVTFTHYNIYANLYIMMIKANIGGGILHFLTKISTKEIVLYSMILFVIDKNCLILLKKQSEKEL